MFARRASRSREVFLRSDRLIDRLGVVEHLVVSARFVVVHLALFGLAFLQQGPRVCDELYSRLRQFLQFIRPVLRLFEEPGWRKENRRDGSGPGFVTSGFRCLRADQRIVAAVILTSRAGRPTGPVGARRQINSTIWQLSIAGFDDQSGRFRNSLLWQTSLPATGASSGEPRAPCPAFRAIEFAPIGFDTEQLQRSRNSEFTSIPTNRLPCLTAAIPVVPLPTNGSRNQIARVARRQNDSFRRAMGFCVGCEPSRFSDEFEAVIRQTDFICLSPASRRINV